MSCLESAKEQLATFLAKQSELYLTIKDMYDLYDEDYEDAESVEDGIYGGDINLEWFDHRDISYAYELVCCQRMLVRALELLEAGDKKSIHNANKAFESLVRKARQTKKSKEEDLRKAQEVISSMNEIIAICDAHRQK